MRRWVVMILAVSCAGCATYSQVFINADGQMQRCAATGQGLIGMATASNAVDDCNKNMRAAGFLEIERAGVVGVTLSDTHAGDPVRVLAVVKGSPADASGIAPGDTIVSIDGQSTTSARDARVLLFGEAETSVKLVTRRGGKETQRGLTRVAYSLVFGTGKKP